MKDRTNQIYLLKFNLIDFPISIPLVKADSTFAPKHQSPPANKELFSFFIYGLPNGTVVCA